MKRITMTLKITVLDEYNDPDSIKNDIEANLFEFADDPEVIIHTELTEDVDPDPKDEDLGNVEAS